MIERIQPFRGLLYNQARVGGLSSVVAPPYDLIGPSLQDELYSRSQYNVVRLEFGRGADRYAAARTTLEQWVSDGVLLRAPKPAIYAYTQKFSVDGKSFAREGLVARVQLEEFSCGRVLPHERTFAGPKEDRLRLLEATQTNLSSIFGLYPGHHPGLMGLGAAVRERAPIASFTDELGIGHELRAIESAGEIAVIRDALTTQRILIADGHHRYETALNYRRLRREAGGNPAPGQPYDYVMMTLVACDDPGLVILPTHRVVHKLRADMMAQFAARAPELFQIEECVAAAELRAKLAAAGRGVLGVALRGQPLRLLKLRDRTTVADAIPHASVAVRELDVTVLHALVFAHLLMLRDNEVKAGGRVEYTIDAAFALDAVGAGRADGAFLMNPPAVADVERVSDSGATMPEKSTYFFPKLITGLVMNPLSD